MGCMPSCFWEIVAGWTLQTFKQIIDRVTKHDQIPLKLYFDDPDDMGFLSSKYQLLT